MNNLPQLCCPKCGSLNVAPGMIKNQNKMPVYCQDCGAIEDVNIKIEKVDENGKLKVTYMPTLIMTEFNKDRIKKFF